ncbi:MAG: type VI immunity family protein [Archangium sp.]
MMAGDYPCLRPRGNRLARTSLHRPPRPRRELLAREVFRLVFYMPHDHPDIGLGVSHAIDSYMRAVGEGPRTITHAHIDYSEGSPLTAKRWETVRRVLRNTKRLYFPDDFSERSRWEIEKLGFALGLLFVGGYGIRNGYELEYKARIPVRPESENTGLSVLTAAVPIEYLEEHGPGRVRQLALDMASQLPFSCGHAGLALRIYSGIRPKDPAFRAEVLRYPGIDLRADWGFEEWMGLRVDGVHWLNFLGSPFLQQLGGAAALRSRLRSPETTLVELDAERVVVSLGERPETGDLAAGKTLPAYRELARVLEPWLESIERLPFAGPSMDTWLGLTEEEARRWWRRFFD